MESVLRFAADETGVGSAPFAVTTKYGPCSMNRAAAALYKRSALWNLIEHGAIIVKGMLDEELGTKARKKKGMLEKMRLLKSQFHNEKVVDPLRKGCELKPRIGDMDGSFMWVEDVLDRVDKVLHDLNIVGSNHSNETGLSFLVAMKLARSQAFHSDFELGGIFNRQNTPRKGASDFHFSAPWAISVIIALSPGKTYLDLPCGQVSFNQYDAIVFAGDLRHAGSRYKELNMRLHVYYEYDDGRKEGKKKVPSRAGERTPGELRHPTWDERRTRARGWADIPKEGKKGKYSGYCFLKS